MKNWLKKNRVYLIGGMLVFIIIMGAVDRCSTKRALHIIEQAELEGWRVHYRDSIQREFLEAENKMLEESRIKDSIQTAFYEQRALEKEKEVGELQNKIDLLKKTSQSAVDDYRKDTIQTVKCNEAIFELEKYIATIESQNIVLKDIIEDKDKAIVGYRTQILRYDQLNKNLQKEIDIIRATSLEKDRINAQLQKQLRKEQTWWRKNEKWIYLGVGVVTTGLILK